MDKRLLLVGLVLSLGCGGTPATPVDAATPMVDSDTPAEDTGVVPPDAFVATPALVLMGGGAPDFTCLGTATAPEAGAAVTANLQIVEFLNPEPPLANQAAEIFSNNIIGAACAAPDCTMAMTDASGDASVSGAANGWFAYRLPPSAGTAQVLAYNREWPAAAGDVSLTAFSMGTIATVSALLSRDFSTTAGAASGTVMDCQGRGIQNASIRLYNNGVEVPAGPRTDRATARITGLQGTSPTMSGLTGDGGTFVGANAPVGNYRVEVYGAMTTGGALELIGCEQGMLVGGGITVFSVGPRRADYPAGSECETATADL